VLVALDVPFAVALAAFYPWHSPSPQRRE
jgi:hypothetical protein